MPFKDEGTRRKYMREYMARRRGQQPAQQSKSAPTPEPAKDNTELTLDERIRLAQHKIGSGLKDMAEGRAGMKAAANNVMRDRFGRDGTPEEIAAVIWELAQQWGENHPDDTHHCLFCGAPHMVHWGGRLMGSRVYENTYICQPCVRDMASQMPHPAIQAQHDWGEWFAPTVMEITWPEAVLLLARKRDDFLEHDESDGE